MSRSVEKHVRSAPSSGNDSVKSDNNIMVINGKPMFSFLVPRFVLYYRRSQRVEIVMEIKIVRFLQFYIFLYFFKYFF